MFLQVLLFLLTVASVYYAGSFLTPNPKLYTLSFFLPLLVHEGGHVVAAALYGTKFRLPYFIPFPFGLGTLGAFMSVRAGEREVGGICFAGILSGMVVALLLFNRGLAFPPEELVLKIGWWTPLIFVLLYDGIPIMNTVTVASTIFLLITFLNLLPIPWLGIDGFFMVRTRSPAVILAWLTLLILCLPTELLKLY